MGFFDLPTVPKTRPEKPAKAIGTLACYKIIQALDLAAMRYDPKRKELGAVRVDFKAKTVAASDAHILVKLGLEDQDFDSLVQTMSGISLDDPGEGHLVHYWVSPASAEALKMPGGWVKSPGSFGCPDFDKAIPTRPKYGPKSQELRPFFAFEVLDRISQLYKLLGINDPAFYKYSFDSLRLPAVETRDDAFVDEGGRRMKLKLTILAMPILNPNMG